MNNNKLRMRMLSLLPLMLAGLTSQNSTVGADPPPLPREELEALSDGFGAAFQAHDAAQAANFFAEDGVSVNKGSGSRNVGPEEIRDSFAALFEAFPDYETVSEERWISGSLVLTEHGTMGTFKNDWHGLPATGKGGSTPLRHLDVWEYRGDKVALKTTYMDLQTFLINVGLMPPVSLPPVSPSFELPEPEGSGLGPVATVEEAIAFLNAGDLAGLARRMATELQVFRPPWDTLVDRPTSIALDEMLWSGMPDRHWDIQRIVELGEGWVLAEVVMKGTHTRPYLGIQPLGRPMEVPVACLYQIDDTGLITDQRVFMDNMTLLRQIGAVPPPLPEAELLAINDDIAAGFQAHDPDQIASYFAENGVLDLAPSPPPLPAGEPVKAFLAELFQGFPDYATIAEERWVQGNIIVTAHTTQGTHLGEWMGIPPTGVSGPPGVHLDIWEHSGDKVQRLTTYMDMQSVLMGLGIIPTPELPPIAPSFELPVPEATGLEPLAAVRQAQALWNAHDLAGVARGMKDDVEVLLNRLGTTRFDRDTYIALEELYFLGFSDYRFDVVRHILLGEGWVVSEVVFKGTHDGPYFGIPATDRTTAVRGAILYHVDDEGLITRMDVYADNLTVLLQLGLFPPLSPDLVIDEFTSPSLAGNLFDDPTTRKVMIYLPPSYDDSPERRYPTVYLLHGFSGDYLYWTPTGTPSRFAQFVAKLDLRLDIADITNRLIAAGEMEEMIIVIPDGGNALWSGIWERSPVLGDYRSYIAKDLVAYLDANYRTIPDRDSRGIGGHSMGGFGAVSMALEYPQTFGAAAALGPELCDVDASPTMIDRYVAVNPETLGYPPLLKNNPDQTINPSGLPVRVITGVEAWGEAYLWEAAAFVGLGAAWTPNLDAPPYYVDLPIQYPEKTVIPELWEQWRQQDLVHQIARDGARLARTAVYVSEGVGPTLVVAEAPGVDRLAAALAAQGIAHTYETFPGDHITELRAETESALKFMSRHLTTALPAIGIERVGAAVVLFWPMDGAEGFALEATATLNPDDWQPVTTPVTVAGNQATVLIDPAEAARYFRLTKP